jgi:hypothetical protein
VSTPRHYDHANQEDRRRVIASAIASQRIEGLEPDRESLADLEEFITGTIDLTEVRARAAVRYFAHKAACSSSPDFG